MKREAILGLALAILFLVSIPPKSFSGGAGSYAFTDWGDRNSMADGSVYASSQSLSASISPSNVVMGSSQSQLFASDISGGQPPYSYQWYLCDALSGNMVINPGFEAGNFTGWNQEGPSNATIRSDEHHTGSYSCASQYNATDFTYLPFKITQKFGVPSNIVSNVGCWYKYGVTDTDWFGINYTDGSVSSIGLGDDVSNWTYETLSLTANKTVDSLILERNASYQLIICIDDVQFNAENGTAVPGATGTSWTFTPASSGSYTIYLRVTDAGGNVVTSNTVPVTVKGQPSVSISPTFANAVIRQSQLFTSNVTNGTPPYTYLWYLDGTPVSGATNPTWSFAPTSLGTSMVYLVVNDSAIPPESTRSVNATVIAIPPTIYIMNDGSVFPSSASISSPDNITYTFTGNVSYPSYLGIVVQRNNTVIDGNGYFLQGNNNSGNGFIASEVNNVTIRDANIEGFEEGIWDNSSSYNTIYGNNITDNYDTAVVAMDSSFNNVSYNNMKNNAFGIVLMDDTSGLSGSNVISGNNIQASDTGVWFDDVSNSEISGNSIEGCAEVGSGNAIWLSSSSNNTIAKNDFTNNNVGVQLQGSSNNRFWHNDFINNTLQVYIQAASSSNFWDNGYPFGGNYWSNYDGIDVMYGPSQDIIGSDGIGDTAFNLDANDIDHYPLMGPFGSSTYAGLNMTVFPSDDVCLIFQNVTVAGSTTVDEMPIYAPALNNLTGEYYKVRVGGSYSGNITLRLILNGSNMTLAQKSRLQLMQYIPLPGDITGPTPGVPDGKVDIRDIAYVAKQFGTTTSSPNWNPISDLTGPNGVPDDKVDIRDIAYVAKRFGTSSSWVNITTYVDTGDNVIYGIIVSFSIICVRQS